MNPDVGGPLDSAGDQVTFVGRASAEKGIEDFVAAARALPELSFVVAGATERVPQLVSNSPRNLRWVGFLQEKELNALYAHSRMLVFPSRWFEGFPNVLTRAMVMERPIIASRIGALPEIVHDGKTGLLFEMKNVEDLVAKIKQLHSDVARCREMGRAGRLKALSHYSPEVVYERLMEAYQKALRNVT
jgi:glycosyltransferase involved in cell wall biosynthesis